MGCIIEGSTIGLIHEILKNLKDALLGCSGGLIGYLYHYSLRRDKNKDAKFDFVSFLINGLVGAFMAYCFGDMIPETSEYRNGIIGFIGVVGFGLMGAIESKFVDNLLNKMFK